MRRMTALSSVAWVPVLSGCMMMGMGAHGMSGSHRDIEQRIVHRAEASSDELGLTLSFVRPDVGAVVPVEAVLRWKGETIPVATVAMQLRVRRPDGGSEELAMQPVSGSSPAAYVTDYGFNTAGTYLLTAEARFGAGTDARRVSVRTETAVGAAGHGSHHDWATPAAIVGGLGMLITMGFMMGPWS